jgi:hypothetical protein
MNTKVVGNYLVRMLIKFQPHCFHYLGGMIFFVTGFCLKFRLDRQMEL